MNVVKIRIKNIVKIFKTRSGREGEREEEESKILSSEIKKKKIHRNSMLPLNRNRTSHC